MKINLTKREKEVLNLVLKEFTSEAISQSLGLSVQTINTHRKNILKKTKSKSIIGLIKYGIRAGLVDDFYFRNQAVKKIKNSPKSA